MSNVQAMLTANLVGSVSARQVAELVVASGGRGKAKSARDIQERVLAYADLETLDAWAEKLANCVKESMPSRDGQKGDGPWWGPVLEFMDALDSRREELVKLEEQQAQQDAQVHQIGEAAA